MIDYVYYITEAWPFVVSTTAAIVGGAAGILKLKKMKLEIEKLEKDADKQEPRASIIKIPTNEEIAELGNIRVKPEKDWPSRK